MEVNGKEYPLWSQFIERKAEWIGGILVDEDCSFGSRPPATEITDITLEPNGKDSAFFAVEGKDYGCGFDVRYGGISGGDQVGDGWLVFSGYGGHTWRIKQKEHTPCTE